VLTFGHMVKCEHTLVCIVIDTRNVSQWRRQSFEVGGQGIRDATTV